MNELAESIKLWTPRFHWGKCLCLVELGSSIIRTWLVDIGGLRKEPEARLTQTNEKEVVVALGSIGRIDHESRC
ncbi:hypothetical protein K443DRAFT_396862 [Laccaria amethystina LaAM-08-1]|jgi:hypothetical protein|uniref:Uncharacterized protein n=1 Tax=Laccaria amethystina LaAM-08-1 TaxID=1095629 RepID=A0A0C9WIT2_9AGAR|nr:hypothetical protein K443DRAFT_396862 [Laccaria amethystina LaAM-08-1]